ncbi:MAG TPA: carboxypeptidase-like regulatory domain-containing protein [Pirellulaceae bacterium]|jgi:hypothetical protein
MLLKTCFLPSRLVLLVTVVAVGAAEQVGCSSGGVKLGRVTGKVTLAGAPLPDALVTFTPTTGGSPSAGRTASDGTYKLNFSRKLDGAMLGEHTVTISTYQPAMEDPPTPEVPEKVPFKYREVETALKATVKSGSNKLDFDLENGPLQPAPSKKKAKSAEAPTCY